MTMRVLVSALFPILLSAQAPLANPTFADADLRWAIPPQLLKTGASVAIASDGCRTAPCARISGPKSSTMSGNLMQSIPAAGYNNHTIRLRAALRVSNPAAKAQLWLRLDAANGSLLFLENSLRNPVTSTTWTTAEIQTAVSAEAHQIALGVMLYGEGEAWIDDVSLDITGDYHTEPSRPLTSRELRNLTAFAKLYGYVRFFHPSDQAAKAEWQALAYYGLRAVLPADSDAALLTSLRAWLAPIAPTVQLYTADPPPLPPALTKAPAKNPEILRYKHHGVGLAESASNNNYRAYNSTRTSSPATSPLPAPFRAALVDGIQASVPLTLYRNSDGTVPHQPAPTPAPLLSSQGDRHMRLADVIIAWNIFQHFYPYFDVIAADWPAELTRALTVAAGAATENDHGASLRRLVAALHDGHGSVFGPGAESYRNFLPIHWTWAGADAILTKPFDTAQLAAGDRILQINNRPIAELRAEADALISSATPQWRAARSQIALGGCPAGRSTMDLVIEPFAAPNTRRPVTLTCVPGPPGVTAELRPSVTAEPAPGIFYLDLTRIKMEDWKTILPKLEAAKGLIFDLRGYPNEVAMEVLAHLAKEPLRSANWMFPTPTQPDRIGLTFSKSGWPLPPRAPHLAAPRVFLTDGRAISYAETVMGIVEHFQIATIIGEATAGTNGNVNPFRLPSGYTIGWTGMQVLKHDGSQHHGIGIRPQIPVTRTRAAIAAGRDEYLEKALQHLQMPATAR